MTWLSVIFVLHWRLSYSRNRVYAALAAGCFVLAFLTFFGVPFVSTALGDTFIAIGPGICPRRGG
jgi:hypothetical protein